MSHISIDIDIDDVIWGMSSYDRKVFFKRMQDEGYISKSCVITKDGEIKAANNVEQKVLAESKDEFNLALQKLFSNGWRLTKEQEDYIIGLAKQIV
jgi:hypothetical protein